MSNIKNKHYVRLDSNLYNDRYMDFMLTGDEVGDGNIWPECLEADFDLSSPVTFEGRRIYSSSTWKDSVNKGRKMEDIGLTGIDNGFIKYDKRMISDADFLDIYTGSVYDLGDEGNGFFMSEVDGNTGHFIYPIERNDGYVTLKGGFYQGFFEVRGKDYQVLPDFIEDEWNFEIVCRRDSKAEVLERTLNSFPEHSRGTGTIFYIGTRAENKFWELYKKSDEMKSYMADRRNRRPRRPGYDETPPSGTYIQDEEGRITIPDSYFAGSGITKNTITDSKGNPIGERGFYEFETDNKHLFFHRAEGGFTASTWDENSTMVMEGKKKPNINYYPILHRGKGGKTVRDIDEIIYDNEEPYNVFADVIGNAFGVRIDEKGRIGYKFSVLDCDEPTHLGLEEEWSREGIVPDREWCTIDIKMKKLTNENECNYKDGNPRMKVMIYVNGFLILVSRELPLFIPRGLADSDERQQAVPFSISLGGGSQGLMESIGLNYYRVSDYILPIEKEYGGTFLGDIRSFRIFGCSLSLEEIKNNDLNKRILIK